MIDYELREPVFEGGTGFDGTPTYTPITPGVPAPAPIPVTPPPVAAPATSSPVALPIAPPTPQAAPTALPVPDVEGTARYSADDYTRAGLALLPRGRVWPKEADSVQDNVMRGLAQSLERVDADASMLLATSLPGSVSPMLPEWEAALGLPDPCLGNDPSFEDRARQVRGRFVGAGGLSRQRYIDFAAALGFSIEIVTFAPFRVGVTPIPNLVADDSYMFLWGVRVVANPGGLSTDVLMCELQAIKPAESTLLLLS